MRILKRAEIQTGPTAVKRPSSAWLNGFSDRCWSREDLQILDGCEITRIVRRQRNIQLHGRRRNPGIREHNRPALLLAGALDRAHNRAVSASGSRGVRRVRKRRNQIASASTPVLHLHAVLDLRERD